MPTKSRMPFRGLVDTFAELNRMQEYWRHPHAGDLVAEPRPRSADWVPTTDIFARGDDVVIRCELAGVDREEVEISYAAGTLVIWGERSHAPDEAGDVGYYVRERRYGPFRRAINLPEGIDKSRIGATFEDGLLEITVRGAASAQEVEEIAIGGRDEGPVALQVGGRRPESERSS